MQERLRRPDWSFWKEAETATLLEAIALSLDIDPFTVERNHQTVLIRVPDQRIAVFEPAPDDFYRRYQLAVRSVGETLQPTNSVEIRQYRDESRVRLNEFVAWAITKGWSTIPEELRQLSSAQRRNAYRGELAAYTRRFKPELLAKLSDDQLACRFADHVEALRTEGKSVLKLPQLRHVANQVAKLRATDWAAQ